MSKAKIKSLPELTNIIKKLKQAGKTIAFTNGCFDILHLGHIKLLKEAMNYADYLIVGINSDSSAKKIKGRSRPVVTQNKRAKFLAELGIIDYLIIFNEKTPFRLIKKIKPDVLIKGGDWHKKDIVGYDFVNSYNGKVITYSYLKGYSTTKIIEDIIKQHGR